MQVMLVLQNTPDASASLVLPGVETSSFEADTDAAQFDLSFNLRETAEGLVGSLSYASQLFDTATAERLAGTSVRFVAAATRAPEALVVDLPLLDGVERDRLVRGFNETAVAYPGDALVVDLFGDQAARRPDAIAVVDGERSLRYGELDAASNRLARHLIGLGVGPERVVGVCLERSAELIVTLLAIWKAGGAYLPLDPSYPEDRLAFMLADAGAVAVVATCRSAARLPGADSGGRPVRVLVDAPDTQPVIVAQSAAPLSDADRLAPLTPDSLAYILYTSGSTGRPKGVAVGHRAIMNRLHWMQADGGFGEDDVILQKTPATFDVSVWEFFGWAMCGARVVMLPPGAHRDPEAVARAIHAHDVTSVHFVPSMFEAFLPHLENLRRSSLQQIYTSGEALPAHQVQAFDAALKPVRLVNLYGPTEAAVEVTSYETRGDEASVPIGAPFRTPSSMWLTRAWNRSRIGVAGELLIGGVQVARGYLGRPALTAEKFVADPFSDAPGARLYRTGDLARWRPDGTLEFLGRIDHQVKIRGMRVEPGEIEAALSGIDGIGQATVVARKNETGDTRLVAHVVPSAVPDAALAAAHGVSEEALTEVARAEAVALNAEGLVDLEAVRSSLGTALPEHMVPSGFVVLSRLPLTSSGKVDRKALPEAEMPISVASYAAPVGEMETAVALAFAEALGVERVGRNDNFFDLGGHSLLAVRLVSRLEANCGRTLALRYVFQAPTVEGLAALLGSDGPRPAYQPLIDLSKGARRAGAPSIVCFPPVFGNIACYAHPRVLGPLSRFGDVLAVQSPGHEPGEVPFERYADMLEAYTSAASQWMEAKLGLPPLE